MARSIDFDNITKEDLEYMKQRPWLLQEAELVGAVLPIIEEPEAVHELVITSEDHSDGAPDGSVPEHALKEDDEEEEEDDELEDYSELVVEDLKAILQDRDLPVSGTKAELVARLEAYDQENTLEED